MSVAERGHVAERGRVAERERVTRLVSRVIVAGVLCAVPALAGAQLALGLDSLADDWRALCGGTVTDDAVILLASAVCLVCWAALILDGLAGLLELRRRAVAPTEVRASLRLLAAVFGASALSLLAGFRSQSDRSEPEVSTASLASLMAGATIAGRLWTPRSRGRGSSSVTGLSLSVEPDRAVTEPRVVVRVFGNPVAESLDGRRARFRKSRSLELLAWLALNRERPLRSAARTAIWDADVSDSTFATVVSEMRRGLSDLDDRIPPRQWSPPSYGDVIDLSVEVCTDADLIGALLRDFRTAPASCATPLAQELCRIRDLPFAGAGYLWPDLDGTTTRLVLLAFTAIDELVRWAVGAGRGREMAPVVAAGLRMIPGSEEMLDLQRRVSGLPEPRRSMASLRP